MLLCFREWYIQTPAESKKAKGESCVNFGREFHGTKHQIIVVLLCLPVFYFTVFRFPVVALKSEHVCYFALDFGIIG